MNVLKDSQEQKFSRNLRNFNIGLVVFAHIFQFGLNPAGAFFSDSYAYGAGDLRNWKLFSLIGHSLRNWPIVLTNLTLGNRILQTSAQFIFSTIVWSILIWYMHRFLNARKFYLASALVLILAISPHVLSWNSVLLGDSYGLSFMVLTIAMCLRWGFTKNRNHGIYFLLGLIGWSSLQSRNFLAFLALTLLIVPLLFLFKIVKLGECRRVIVLVMTLLIFYVGAISVNQQNQDYYADNAISYRALTNIYTFAAHSQSGIIKSELKKQPGFDCMGIEEMTDVIAISKKLVSECPVAHKWLEHSYLEWYLKFLLLHPAYSTKLLLEGLAASNNPSEFYAGTVSIAPTLFNGLFFGSRNYSFGTFENVENKMLLIENDKQQIVVITKGETKSYNAVKANAPIFFWIFLALFLFISRIISFYKKKTQISPHELDPMYLVLFLSLLGFAINLLISPAEYFRLTIQFSVALFLSVTLILAKVDFLNQVDHAKIESWPILGK